MRFVQYRVENRRKIAVRPVDDLQDLGSSGLPLQRFGKFSFTLGKATPQIGYQLFGVG